MPKDKKALREMFASKVEDAPEEEVTEEEVVEETPEEEVVVEEEVTEEAPTDEGEDFQVIIDSAKEAYSVFETESENDPMMALDNLIEALGALRGGETEMGEEEFLPGNEAPLNEMPLNM